MRYIDPTLLERVNKWLTPFFDTETQNKIKDLIAHNTEELEDSFYKNLAFGTGGMRGIMGPGDNRINKYTLGKNTQGLANYLKKCFTNNPIKVAIAYDCRHNSKEFARIVANVFSANGIKVYLFSDLRPTPELSFAVRHLNCQCGIVLTASHNPPEYNGYKVYWEDGGQLVPPQDDAVISEINALHYTDVNFDGNDSLIEYIDKDIDKAFIDASIQNGTFDTSEKAKQNLNIVFTSLHGTSITMVPQTLKQAGYSNVHIVKEQETPDGDFPTVVSPNPEEPAALKMALELANSVHADLVIGTDPDCDRLGIAVRNNKGELELLNGNQAMVIKTHFLLEQWKKLGRLTGNQFIASTVVSTPMIKQIAEHYDVNYKQGLTGFKWIAKMIKDYPELEFIGGGEESFGYLTGSFVRDKDAVTASLLVCEIAAQCKEKGSSIYEYLQSIYKEYGYYKEHLIAITKKGKKGAEEIAAIMQKLRDNPMLTFNNSKVVKIEDYSKNQALFIESQVKEPLNIPNSNVLIYYTEDQSKIAARPSGTEPKIKFYISVYIPAGETNAQEKAQDKINAICAELNAM